jgi:hypothetical protein
MVSYPGRPFIKLDQLENLSSDKEQLHFVMGDSIFTKSIAMPIIQNRLR